MTFFIACTKNSGSLVTVQFLFSLYFCRSLFRFLNKRADKFYMIGRIVYSISKKIGAYGNREIQRGTEDT